MRSVEACDNRSRRGRQANGRRRSLSGAFCLALLMALLGPAASGQAALVHSFDTYFGGGALSTPEELAVDQTTGDVYALEHGSGCVSRFYGERGGPEALEPHDFPATGTNQVCGLEFREEASAAAVAVDNSGTSTEGAFYVNSPATNGGFGGTRGYDKEGNLVTELASRSADGGLLYVCGVTSDAEGNVYVAERYGGVQKFNHNDPVTDADYAGGVPSEGPACAIAQNSVGSWYGSWPTNGPLIHSGVVLRDTSLAIGLDPSSDDVYISEGGVISGITSDGIQFDQFGSGKVSEARGVAIDRTTGIAYVSDTPNGRIALFEGSPTYRVGVDFSGTGLGAVSADSPPIEACGDEGQCVGYYVPSSVVLKATPQPHSKIDGWTGCDELNPAGDECTVEVTNANREVVANFTRLRQTVTASTAGTGAGSVSDVDGLGAIQDCGAAGTCAGLYDEGSLITLVATPSGHSSFTGWSGACTSQSGPCELVVEGEPSVTAHFTAQHAISVKKAGTGAGAVTSEPGGVDCGGVCVGYFTDGTSVSLTPVSSGHSTFTGWSGACSGMGACEVEAGEATKTVTATFAHETPSAVTDPGASFVGQHVATVHGSVNPNGARVSRCVVEYGPTPSYGAQSPCVPSAVGSGDAAVPIGVDLKDLRPGTTYHYRLSASNVGGSSNGADQTFRTLDDTCDTNDALCPPPVVEKPKSSCRRGFVLRKGQCVKKRRHHGKRHRRRHRRARR